MPISSANISLRQLSAFAAVVDCGGFNAAAGALHMTQSAVSQAVLSLERTLEGPLLVRDRSARAPLQLTALGTATLAHARHAIASVECIVGAAASGDHSRVGILRVASIQSVATQLAAPARQALAFRYPLLDVRMWIGTDREVHQWMADGCVDVGLVGPLLGALDGATVVPLMEDPWYVAFSPTHALAKKRSLSLRSLRSVPYVMADGGCEPAVRALFAAAGGSPLVAHRAQGIDTIIAMVADGLGVTLLPELGIQTFAVSSVRTVRVSPVVSRMVAAVLPGGSGASAEAQLFISALQDEVAQRAAGPRARHERSHTGTRSREVVRYASPEVALVAAPTHSNTGLARERVAPRANL